MGAAGKGGSQTQVTDYLMSIHMGVCAGPVDAITGIYVDQKPMWEGEVTAEIDLQINLPKLFGGPKQQGGCVGNVHCFFGTPTQTIPDVIANYFGATSATCPGYRGMVSLFFSGNSILSAEAQAAAKSAYALEGGKPANAVAKSFLWTSNDPVIAQNLSIKVRWIPSSLNTTNGRIAALVDTDFLIGNATSSGQLAENIADSVNANSRFFSASASGNKVVIQAIRTDSEWLSSVDATNTTDAKESLTITPFTWANNVYSCTLTISDPPVPSGGTFTVGPDTYTFYEGGDDANPAHIIFACLTNTDWGLGYPATLIDVGSFNACAATLYAESLGLSLMWSQQAKIEDFVNEILNHIQAVFYVDPGTGLMTLKLVRDDYDPTTLVVYDPDNAVLTSHQQRDWGDTINEIVVTWTNPLTEQGETVSVQDLGNIGIQGTIVSDSRNYYGVRNAQLALKLAARELRSVSAPLTTVELEIDRSAWDLLPGNCFILNWPENNISNMVCRIGKVDYGKLDDPKITITAVQDIFSLDHPPVVIAPSTGWSSPGSPPSELKQIQIFTLPYFLASSAFLQSKGIPLTYPEVTACVFGYTDDRTVHDFYLFGQTHDTVGNEVWAALCTLVLTECATLAAPLNAEAASTIPCNLFAAADRAPDIGDIVLIGGGDTSQELCAVTGNDGVNYTLSRGVLDTVPQAWGAGTLAWAATKGLLTVDEGDLYSAEETVEYKILPRGTGGTLSLDAAIVRSQQLTARPYLPLRPANVQVNGAGFGPLAVGSATTLKVTWATRNRLFEDSQTVAWTAGSVTPEYLQQTIVTVTDMTSGQVVYQQGSLWTETELDLPVSWFNRYASIKIAVSSSVNGVASLQAHSIVVTGLPGNAAAAPPPAAPTPDSPPSPISPPGANTFQVTSTSNGDSFPALTISGVPDTTLQNASLAVRYRVSGTQPWLSAAPLAIPGQILVSLALTGLSGDTAYDVEVAYLALYDDAYVTSQWVTAGGSPVTTGESSASGLGGVALPAPNRIPFSQMEKGTYGWQSVSGEETTSSALHTATGADSLTYAAMAGTGNGATDGGIYIAVQQADLVPVTADETLFVGAKTILGGACTGQISVQWFNSSEIFISQVNDATGVIAADGVARVQGGFVTVPANAAFASLEISANGTVGTTQGFSLQFTDVVLCSALPGQTTWPSFVAGPNAVPGADVTSDNTASGIEGQGAWATANITYATAAPASPQTGDIWVNTSKVPNVWQSWNGTQWVSTTPIDTSQLADGAGLGKTAVWGSVSSRPANVAALSGSEVIDNSKVPAGGVNRVLFSLFEKGTAYWTSVNLGAGVTGPVLFTSTAQGYSYIECEVTAAASGDAVSIWSSESFPVIAGETLYLSAVLGTQNCTVYIGLAFYDQNGNNFSDVGTSQAYKAWPASESTVITVPANAKTAYFFFFFAASGPGSFAAAMAQPFVCGIGPGQTSFPAFNPGPAAVPGADVTGDNTASGIWGQGGLATKDNVGTGDVISNAITNTVAAASASATTITSPYNGNVISLNITTQGGPVLLNGSFYYDSSAGGSGWNVNGGTTAAIGFIRDSLGVSSGSSNFAGEYQQSTGHGTINTGASLSCVDYPPAGSHTYSIAIALGTGQSPTNYGQVSGKFLSATELKR